MKKTLLVLFIFLAQAASATSLRNVRLELEILPLHHGMEGRNTATYIHVFGDGEVQGSECYIVYRPGPGVTGPRCFKSEKLDQLGQSALRKLNRNIRKAAKGTVLPPDPNAISCLAMPFEQRTYSAENGSVMLLSGAFPCGGANYNNSKAARKLVEQLDGYRAKFRTEFDE